MWSYLVFIILSFLLLQLGMMFGVDYYNFSQTLRVRQFAIVRFALHSVTGHQVLFSMSLCRCHCGGSMSQSSLVLVESCFCLGWKSKEKLYLFTILNFHGLQFIEFPIAFNFCWNYIIHLQAKVLCQGSLSAMPWELQMFCNCQKKPCGLFMRVIFDWWRVNESVNMTRWPMKLLL